MSHWLCPLFGWLLSPLCVDSLLQYFSLVLIFTAHCLSLCVAILRSDVLLSVVLAAPVTAAALLLSWPPAGTSAFDVKHLDGSHSASGPSFTTSCWPGQEPCKKKKKNCSRNDVTPVWRHMYLCLHWQSLLWPLLWDNMLLEKEPLACCFILSLCGAFSGKLLLLNLEKRTLKNNTVIMLFLQSDK